MIVLTADEAEKVQGRSPKDAAKALRPVPLKDGRFMLGEQVLDDPAHADVRDFLERLPREPIERLPLYTEDDALPADRLADVASLPVREAD